MSSSLRIALVAEGRTEFEVVNAALTAILAPRSFVLVLVQPDATRPQLGAGWGGVLKWCHQAAERAREALAVEKKWPQVVARCSRAAEFEQSVKAVFS